MSKKEYGVVLIGCGHIGQSHIEDIYYREGVRIVGTVDVNRETAALFAKKYGAASYGTDYRPYLEREDVDIVIIATYVNTHLSILKDCLAKGKHVLCEKPLTANLEEGRAFCDLVRSHPECKVLIAHILRHNGTYLRVKQMIADGMIGDIKLIRMAQNHHIMNKARYSRLLCDCPPIVDCGVHYIDVIRWFTGAEITSISGLGQKIGDAAPEGSYNYGLLSMKLSNGASAYYEAGWADTMAALNMKEFIGEKGRLRLILQADRTENREEGDLIQYYNAETKTYQDINNPAVYKNMWGQLQCLIDMIEGRSQGNPTLEDAFKALAVVLAGDRSIREGRTIDLTREECY